MLRGEAGVSRWFQVITTFLMIALFLPAAGFAEDDKAGKKSEAAATKQAPPGDKVSADEPSPSDSPLVRAAKSSKAKKSKKSVVITDADVKKSTGKLSIISSRELPPAAEQAVAPEKAEAAAAPAPAAPSKQTAREEAQARYEKAQQEVETLMREVSTAEEDYYNEDDATIRDQVIEARFDRARKRLDAARAELENAREALRKLD